MLSFFSSNVKIRVSPRSCRGPSRPSLHNSVSQKERVLLWDSCKALQQGMWYTRSIHWCIHRCTDPQRSDHFVTLQVLNQENAELRAHLDMLKIRQLFKSECPAQWKGCCCSAYICCFDHLYDRFTTCMVVSYWLIQFFQLLDQSTARDVVERNPFYLQHKGSNRAAAQRSHPAVVLTRRVEEHQPEHSPMAQLTRRAEH